MSTKHKRQAQYTPQYATGNRPSRRARHKLQSAASASVVSRPLAREAGGRIPARVDAVEREFEVSFPSEQDVLDEHETAAPATDESHLTIIEAAEEIVARATAALDASAVEHVAPAPIRPPQPVRPVATTKRTPAMGVSARRVVRSARIRTARAKRSRLQLITQAIAALLLICVLGAAGMGVASARNQYEQLHALATDAMSHIHTIQALLPSQGSVSQVLDASRIDRIHTHLAAAERDFSTLRAELGAPSGALGVADMLPVASRTLDSAAALAAAADEACLAGLDLLSSAGPIVGVLHDGLLAQKSGTRRPALTPRMLSDLAHNYDSALTHLDNAVTFAQAIDFTTLPSSLVKPSEEHLLQQALTQWPQIRSTLVAGQAWLAVAPVLLGVKSPEKLLFIMQDRTELRATGGFMGNYGVATISGGRMDPFTLRNTYLLDYPYLGRTGGYSMPAVYDWWPFGGFAMRDANLAGDFPTSAQLIMKVYRAEGGAPVNGVVAFTPVPVEQALELIGPVRVPGYPDVVTASNLEDRIHIHQLTGNLPYLERKAFTAALAKVILDKVRAMPVSEMLKLVKAELPCLLSKDIQIYFADSRAEALLKRYGVTGAISSGPGDGVAMVDDNVGGNKINQFVTAAYTDNVTLNRDGSATHSLTITYNLRVINSSLVFGREAYYAMARVYTPKGAQLLHIDGLYSQIDQSDLPWRQMWGGRVYARNGVPYVVHLIWRVPHAATHTRDGKWAYTLDFQHQAGSHQTLNLTITAAGAKKPLVRFNNTLDQDHVFTVSY